MDQLPKLRADFGDTSEVGEVGEFGSPSEGGDITWRSLHVNDTNQEKTRENARDIANASGHSLVELYLNILPDSSMSPMDEDDLNFLDYK